MAINTAIFDKPIAIDTIPFELENGEIIDLDILRLDKIHETISGNKWFKLKYNLLESEKNNADTVLSFGGAYSNHLHALAYAGKLFNIKTVGIVRGEEVNNPTLNDCRNWGMELHFISRSEYRKKTETTFLNNLQEQFPEASFIPEGGDNQLGQKGCKEILSSDMIEKYDILCCSIGTGTTITGFSNTFYKETQLTGRQAWGFAPFKNAHSLKEKLMITVPNLHYIDDYHFGGFGKIKPELEEFMDKFRAKHHIELDRVYTGKMFFGLQKELAKEHFKNKKILVVHTGGLQGNRGMY